MSTVPESPTWSVRVKRESSPRLAAVPLPASTQGLVAESSIQAPILDRLAHVLDLDLRRSLQVGDSTGHLQDAIVRSGREPQLGDRHAKKVVPFRIYRTEGADVSGRRKPVPIVGTEFQIGVNYVIAAIGQKPEELTDHGIKTSADGTIIINERGVTSDPAIFAGGDICSGGATVIQAMAEGVNAAKNIEKYLT